MCENLRITEMKENGRRTDLLDGGVRDGFSEGFFSNLVVVGKRRDCWSKW